MDIVARGSEYQDYLQCKRKHFHGWVEKITPIRPDNKLFIGTIGHKWLENYYKNNLDSFQTDLDTSVWMNEQDMSGMEQVDIDDTRKLIKGVTENYVNTYFQEDLTHKTLGTEIEFLILLDDGVFFTGTIDRVYENEEGEIYFTDHKFVSSLDMYEEKSKLDRQISRYWWALQKISEGVGRIKFPAPHEGAEPYWGTWKELLGREIKGFIYNLIAKDYPREPRVLKPKKGQIVGDLSQDKSQKTTYDKYMKAILDRGEDPAKYQEFLDMLKAKPNPFTRRVVVRRNQHELDSSILEFYHTVNDMHDTVLAIQMYPHKLDSIAYRNIGTHCDHMCQFKALCQAAIAGDNVQFIKNLAYKKNEDRIDTDKGAE